MKKIMIITFCLITLLSLTLVCAEDINSNNTQLDTTSQTDNSEEDYISLDYNVKSNDNDIEIKNVDSDLNGGWNSGYDAYTYVKRVCVNESDKINIDIKITDRNSKPVENVTVFIGNEENILKTNEDGKTNYSFITQYSDLKGDNDLYYGYNDILSIIVPGQRIKNNSTYVSGIITDLLFDITKTNNDNNTEIKENNSIKENSTTYNTPTPIAKNKNKQNVKTSKNNHIKTIKEITPVKYNILTLDEGLNVTLSWLEQLFNKTFDNKQLLIYIDDTLVFKGNASSNSTEILFEIVKKYKGVHVLKVVEGENVYEREFM
jgi:hypothetical protein